MRTLGAGKHEPSEAELAELGRRDALTPWARRNEDVEREKAALREQAIGAPLWCATWEQRPLLCKLGIHRPHRRIGEPKNDYGHFQCLRCGFEWGGLWSNTKPGRTH